MPRNQWQEDWKEFQEIQAVVSHVKNFGDIRYWWKNCEVCGFQTGHADDCNGTNDLRIKTKPDKITSDYSRLKGS